MGEKYRYLQTKRSQLLIAGIVVANLSGCSSTSFKPVATPSQVSKAGPDTPPTHAANVSIVKPPSLHEALRKQAMYGKLKIDNLEMVGDVVHITGETDLPNGSMLTVTLDVQGRSEDAESIAVSKEVTVSAEHFSAALTRPSRPEFLRKPCVVSLLFSPFAQSTGVQAIVGANGEYLSGSAVDPMTQRDPRLMKTLEVSKKLTAKFHSGSQDQVAQKINPTNYATGSPERALAEFLSAWQRRNYGAMRKACQTTWLSGQDNSGGWLRNWFDLKKLLGAKIGGRDEDGNSVVKLSATITYAAGADVQTHQIHVMVIKEAQPYTPDPRGKWGVNPMSAIKED